MSIKISIHLIIIQLMISKFKCIPCNFEYKEDLPNYPHGEELVRLDLELENNQNYSSPSYDSFSCEEGDDDDDFDLYRHRALANEDEQESHEIEDIESSCQVRRRAIQPKALNNIYNRLTKVINTENFVQSINIEECINTKEHCNSNVVPPHDKKYICRQKFVRITLKALSDFNVVFDDQFYYPSHCVCELVAFKRKTKKPMRKKATRRCFALKK